MEPPADVVCDAPQHALVRSLKVALRRATGALAWLEGSGERPEEWIAPIYVLGTTIATLSDRPVLLGLSGAQDRIASMAAGIDASNGWHRLSKCFDGDPMGTPIMAVLRLVADGVRVPRAVEIVCLAATRNWIFDPEEVRHFHATVPETLTEISVDRPTEFAVPMVDTAKEAAMCNLYGFAASSCCRHQVRIPASTGLRARAVLFGDCSIKGMSKRVSAWGLVTAVVAASESHTSIAGTEAERVEIVTRSMQQLARKDVLRIVLLQLAMWHSTDIKEALRALDPVLAIAAVRAIVPRVCRATVTLLINLR